MANESTDNGRGKLMAKEEAPVEFKILCLWCNAVWTAKMVATLEFTAGHCSTCGYGEEKSATIDIYCKNCERLVYRKEVED